MKGRRGGQGLVQKKDKNNHSKIHEDNRYEDKEKLQLEPGKNG